MLQKNENFKKLVELLKVYESLSDVQITAVIKSDKEVFQFSNGKIKREGK